MTNPLSPFKRLRAVPEVAERDVAGDTEVVAWRFEERLEWIDSERRFCGVGLRYVTTDEDLTEGPGVGAGVIVRGCKAGVDWRDGMGVIRRGLAVDAERLVIWCPSDDSERRFCGVGLWYVTTDEDLPESGVGAGVIVRGCKAGVDWRDGMGVIRRGLAVDTEGLGVLWSCETAECR